MRSFSWGRRDQRLVLPDVFPKQRRLSLASSRRIKEKPPLQGHPWVAVPFQLDHHSFSITCSTGRSPCLREPGVPWDGTLFSVLPDWSTRSPEELGHPPPFITGRGSRPPYG